MKLAHDWSRLACAPLAEADLEAVVALETSVYPQPWTRRNFMDSLANNDQAMVLRDPAGGLMAYFLLMVMVDEAHLLNLAVQAERQGQGVGRFLLDLVLSRARELRVHSVLLEVRPSNRRALDLYRRYVFIEIGRRKAYYPAHQGQREDAIVMRFSL